MIEPMHAPDHNSSLADNVMDSSASDSLAIKRPPKHWIEAVFAERQLGLVAYVAVRLGGNREDARDVVQEAFVKLCQQVWPDIEPHATAWLYKTCRNRAIDILRREKRMRTADAENDLAAVQDEGVPEPDTIALQDEQVGEVQQQIRQLSGKQQEVLRLRIHDGLSYKQIADITGLSVSNVGVQLHDAVSRLRAKLVTSG